MVPVLNSWASPRNLCLLFYTAALSMTLSVSINLSKGVWNSGNFPNLAANRFERMRCYTQQNSFPINFLPVLHTDTSQDISQPQSDLNQRSPLEGTVEMGEELQRGRTLHHPVRECTTLTVPPSVPHKVSFGEDWALDPRGSCSCLWWAECRHRCCGRSMITLGKNQVVNQRQRIPRPARMVGFLLFLDYA